MPDEVKKTEEKKGTKPTSGSGKKKVSFAGRRDKRRGGNRRGARPAPEFEQNILGIRRVVRVVAGGRRFSFSVSMVIGDRKGRVGFGIGKASDTALAIEKAAKKAKKSLMKIPITKDGSIPREVDAKFCGSRVAIRPARGRGLSAGGAVRSVLTLAGVTDVSAKILSRSKNSFNNAKAALKALAKL